MTYGMTITVIGLDPADHFGWSVFRDGKRIASGVELLRENKESPGYRPLRARAIVVRLVLDYAATAVGYEKVRRHKGTAAAHVYGAYEHAIWEACDTLRIVPLRGVEVTKLKKYATGSGNAGKDDMIKACKERIGHDPIDDNEADACWVAHYIMDEIGHPTLFGDRG